MTKDLLARIELNPRVLGGKPVIRGTRISVEMILEQLVHGASIEQINSDYDLTGDDVRAALLYAYQLVANEEILEVA